MIKYLAAAAFAISALAFPALPLRADPAAAPGLSIDHAWLRATPKGAKVAGGYVTITNKGTTPDRLTGASLDVAVKGEVHTMSMENGVMHMTRLDQGLVIAPGATVTLQPGGNHLMFLNPTAPLAENASAKGTLTFEKAGKIPVTFAIAGMAAKAAPGTSAPAMGAMDMPGMKGQ